MLHRGKLTTQGILH